MDEIWIKQEPYVDERGMWMPVNEYVKKDWHLHIDA